MNSENSKTFEPYRLLSNLADKINLKVVFARFLLVWFVFLKESTFEIRKNVFYFTLKALFILEIIRF